MYKRYKTGMYICDMGYNIHGQKIEDSSTLSRLFCPISLTGSPISRKGGIGKEHARSKRLNIAQTGKARLHTFPPHLLSPHPRPGYKTREKKTGKRNREQRTRPTSC